MAINFTNNLRQVRIKHRDTMTELAKKLSVSRQTIYNIEYHNIGPSLGLAKRIEELYGETVFFEEQKPA